MFEYTDPSLRGEVYSNMNSGVLELKLHEVHFADKFSGAELGRRSTWSTYSAPSLRSRGKAEFLVQETLAGVGGGGRVPEPPS